MTRNTLKLDFSGFEGLLAELDAMGGDVKAVTDRALREASVQVMNATILAVQKTKLPARGKYSSGDTRRSIIHWAEPEWEGSVGWVPVGFDFSKVGAGGFLISGTPRMQPDKELRRIYKGKKFMNQVQNGMLEKVWDEMMKRS